MTSQGKFFDGVQRGRDTAALLPVKLSLLYKFVTFVKVFRGYVDDAKWTRVKNFERGKNFVQRKEGKIVKCDRTVNRVFFETTFDTPPPLHARTRTYIQRKKKYPLSKYPRRLDIISSRWSIGRSRVYLGPRIERGIMKRGSKCVAQTINLSNPETCIRPKRIQKLVSADAMQPCPTMTGPASSYWTPKPVAIRICTRKDMQRTCPPKVPTHFTHTRLELKRIQTHFII